jgi:hypothetical protein
MRAGSTIEVAGTIDDNVTIASGNDTTTIEQWPGQARAVVDGKEKEPVFTVYSGTLNLNGITVTGGRGLLTGGGIWNLGGAVTVNDSTIANNVGIPHGGGILNWNVLTVTDSTITNNTAGIDSGAAGGAIYNANVHGVPTATVTDSTITDNVAGGNGAGGGGIVGGATTIGASIVAMNTANGSTNNCVGSDGTFLSTGYNLTDDATGTACGFTQGTDKVDVNPDLGPLADNGGTTGTMLPALTSPAVGVIPSPTSLNGVPVCGPGAFDQRGVHRPGPGHLLCTIGAVEGSSPSLSGGASMTASPDGTGYWVSHPDGGVFSFGSAPFLGSVPGLSIHVSNIVGIATTSDGLGYWLVGSDGGVFTFGDAGFFGSMVGRPLDKPVVAIVAGPNGKGYWLVASDGGVFAFGDAGFFGSMGDKHLNAAVVDMAADPTGGYWLVASDGGVFNFGGAPFLGSMEGTALAKPMVGVTGGPGGSGYWLVASDGGVFTFGTRFAGSLGGSTLSIIGLFSANGGNGYTLVEANGTAHAF